MSDFAQFVFGGKKSHEQSQETSQSSSEQGSQNSSLNEAINAAFNGSDNSSTSTSSSSNQAYPMLSQMLSGQVSNGTTANNDLAALLGVGGDPTAQANAFSNWRNGTGYQFGLNQGLQGITGSNATKGLLNSGSTLRSLNTFGQDYADTKYQGYQNSLMNLITGGTQAANTIGGVGNVSNSSSTSTGTSFGQSGGQSFGGSQGTSYGTSQSTSQGTKEGNASEKPGISKFIGQMIAAGG